MKTQSEKMGEMMRNGIAAAMGDTAGIGVEILMKAFDREEIFEKCAPF